MINILLSIYALATVSFHSLSFQDIDGNTINMNAYQGKKVLLVNIASGSDKVSQLLGLQQLQQQYGDSLVIIVFPSNSFGHEPKTNAEIKQLCHSEYNSTFVIAAKSSVSGTNVNSVFSWLAEKTQNGELDAPTGGDFQKFLVDKDGMLMGVFSPKVKPTDNELIESITAVLQ